MALAAHAGLLADLGALRHGAAQRRLPAGEPSGQDQQHHGHAVLPPRRPGPGGADPATGRRERLHRVINARTDAVDDTLHRLLWWSVAGLPLTAGVSVGVGWLFAGRVLAPVHTITSRARAISADSLDERVSLGGPHDELRELADTFDSLLDRIHQAFAGGAAAGRDDVPRAATHRWPTSRLRSTSRCRTPPPRRRSCARPEVALDQNRRAHRTIEALLTLAGSSPGQASRAPPVDLDVGGVRGGGPDQRTDE